MPPARARSNVRLLFQSPGTLRLAPVSCTWRSLRSSAFGSSAYKPGVMRRSRTYARLVPPSPPAPGPHFPAQHHAQIYHHHCRKHVGRLSHGRILSTVVIDTDFLPAWAPAHVESEETAEPVRERHETSTSSHQLHSPSIALEVRVLVRLLVAVIVGGIIGVERRTANSLAGVRTFSLVSLGASMFMSTALVGFPQSDPVRFGAAISTSVGFLGAGAMHQGRTYRKGMTTAAGIWLAAALGIAAAAGMFLVAFTGSIATVLISRYLRFDSSLHLIRYKDEPLYTEEEDDHKHHVKKLVDEPRKHSLSSSRNMPDERKDTQHRLGTVTSDKNGANGTDDRYSAGSASKDNSNGFHVQASDEGRD